MRRDQPRPSAPKARAGSAPWESAGRLCLALWLLLPGLVLGIGAVVTLLSRDGMQWLSSGTSLGLAVVLVLASLLVFRGRYGLAVAFLGADLVLWVLSLALPDSGSLGETPWSAALRHGVFPTVAIVWVAGVWGIPLGASWLRKGLTITVVMAFLGSLPDLGGSIGTAAGVSIASRSRRTAPAAGRRLPVMRFRGMSGEIVRLDEHGVTYIVNFWATWCQPCLEELPELRRLSVDLENHPGVRVLAVNAERLSLVELRSFVDRENLQGLPVYSDPESYQRYLAVRSLPATLVLQDREVIKRFVGYRPGLMDDLKRTIQNAREELPQEELLDSPDRPVP